MNMKTLSAPVIALVLFVSNAAVLGESAAEIIKASGVRGGLVVHVGCGDGKLTAALRVNDSYLVHGLDSDPANVKTARDHIRSRKLYGKVSAELFDGKHLPYVDNLVNLLVAGDLGGVTRDEVMRVLCPNGVAYYGGKKIVKPRPKEIDEWTHWLHGADGNAVANDTVVGPPARAQWLAEPRWQRHHEATPSVSAVVTSGGRLFAIINEAPPGIDTLPDKWTLVARDAFNGKLLWKRPLSPWGWREWSDHSYGHGRWNLPTHIARRLAAVGDRVYVTLGFNSPLTALDAATGETVKTYPKSEFTNEILYHDGTLVLSVNVGAQGPGHVKDKPPVKKAVVAINAKTGHLLWRSGEFDGASSKADAIERVTHLTLVLGGGKVFLVGEDEVAALDLKTGKRVWSRDRGTRKKQVTYGHYYFTNLSGVVYYDGVVLLTEPNPNEKHLAWNAPAKTALFGISADTGKELWTRQCGVWGHYNPGDLFIIDNLAWIHSAPEFSIVGLDPRSGQVKRTVSTREALDQGHHHRCYRNKATTRYFITGRRGTEFTDVKSGATRRNHWVRGTCRYGIMPANGLLYAPPHPCVCYITAKLNGFWAIAPARGTPASPAQGDRLIKGTAYGNTNTRQPLGDNSGDWPTYRHDAGRSGQASTKVPTTLKTAWAAPLGGRLSSPVIAEGKVFVASPDTHTVWALDQTDGKPAWSYTAGGRVDTPPTIYKGMALFGSADGWVYCLRAADGKLAWRLRAGSEDVRMMNRDQLESPWPIHGSVLIQGGQAYIAAGRSSFLDGGIYVLVVDPVSGKVLRENRVYSPDAKTGDMAKALMPYDMPPDALGALSDILVGDGQSIYMRHMKFDPTSLNYSSAAKKPKPRGGKKAPQIRRRKLQTEVDHLMSTAGMLDDSWFSQTYWTINGKSHCKLLVYDAETAYGVKPFSGTARHSRSIFKPATAGYTLFAGQRTARKPRWSKKVPVRIRGMVIAGDKLFVAGAMDVVDPKDPWATIEGRSGAVLWAVSPVDGVKLAEYKLDAPPIFDGLTAASGRLYLSTTDGKVVCMQGKKN
jgi:outer membrane protein assembly factor BamB